MAVPRPTSRTLRALVGAAAVVAVAVAVPSRAATPDQSCTAATPAPIALAAPILGQTFTAKLDPLTRLDIPLLFAKPYTGELELRLSVHLPTDAALSTNQVLAVSKAKLKATKAGTVQWVTFAFDPPVATTTRDVVGAYTMEIYTPEAKDLTRKPPVFGWVACAKPYDAGKPFYRMADFIGAAGPVGVTQLGGGRIAIDDVADLQFRSWTV